LPLIKEGVVHWAMKLTLICDTCIRRHSTGFGGEQAETYAELVLAARVRGWEITERDARPVGYMSYKCPGCSKEQRFKDHVKKVYE
jgi:hypothetical protein